MSTVTSNALVKRINRKLAPEGELLRTTRGQRAIQDLGHHYILDIYTNGVLAWHCDLEELGRELGVLKAYEGVGQ